MNFQIETDGLTGSMNFEKEEGLKNNIFLSLAIPQGAWFLDPTFGLRVRPGLKNTEQVAALKKADIEEALQWLITAGKASRIEVAVERDPELQNRLKVQVEVFEANGNRNEFTYFAQVV